MTEKIKKSLIIWTLPAAIIQFIKGEIKDFRKKDFVQTEERRMGTDHKTQTQ